VVTLVELEVEVQEVFVLHGQVVLEAVELLNLNLN
jgi:hypothetical protein